MFGGSLRASGEINARNELISEGQIAQQLIASRLQSAFYIYPAGRTLQLTTGGSTTPNTVRAGAGQNWTVGTDPFMAMIMPPRATGQCPDSDGGAGNPDACFVFYAYYPIVRSTFIASNPNISPPADAANANVWLLMEYRANLLDGVNRSNQLDSPPSATTVSANAAGVHPTIRGRSGQMLVDYVQPQTFAGSPSYTVFRICDPAVSTAQPNCPSGTTSTSPRLVDFNLRLLQHRGGKALGAPTNTAPLSTRVYPRNWVR